MTATTATLTSKEIPAPGTPGLVGLFVHTYRGEVLHFQGQIRALTATHALIQLYSFIDGHASHIEAFPLSDIENWRFYETRDSWLAAYDDYDATYNRRHRSPKAAEAEGGL